MKKTIIILTGSLVFFLAALIVANISIYGFDYFKKGYYKGYNEYNDNLINNSLNKEKPIKITKRISGDAEFAEIFFKEFSLRFSHFKKVPYENEEYYFFSCTKLNGESVYIDKSMLTAKSKLKPETYVKLQKYFEKILESKDTLIINE
jgi:hypothetical protein